MKKIFFLLIFLSCVSKIFATHIAGGELFYEYVGTGTVANTERYKITMRLFRECNPPNPTTTAQLNGEIVIIGIYSTATLTLQNQIQLTQQFVSDPPSIQNTPGINPCLTGNPVACYQIGTYSATIDLPITTSGYTLSWIRYTRTSLANAFSSPTTTGATFVTQIPGSSQLNGGHNSSPQFAIKDTSIICNQSNFIIDFSATDTDNDSLVYKFKPAYDGASGINPLANPDPPPPATLGLIEMSYLNGYTGYSPLGASVSINSKTGIISGKAPTTGKYVVCVVVEEWRNGVLLNSHRKDFMLTIADCSLTAAALKPTYITCNGFTLNFQNESSSSSVTGYYWKFGDINNSLKDTSTLPTPTYTFKDTGTFTMQLKVTSTRGCADSANATVKVYPGFEPGFTTSGSCFLNPYQFTNTTVTKYGVIDSTFWTFSTNSSDTSSQTNPQFKYTVAGKYPVSLYVSNSKGCSGTINDTLNVVDKPQILLPFKDTLICSIDSLPVHVQYSGGTVSWWPNYRISALNNSNIIIYPQDSTKYYVTVSNNGCINTDSVSVNVLKYISVDAGADTAICKTDSIKLRPTSYALSYRWVASTGEVIANVKYPDVQPLASTIYYVTANLGKCQAHDSVLVQVFPYPQAKAFPDTTICYGDRIQLQGNIIGNTFLWTTNNNTSQTLLNRTYLNPIAAPKTTTQYILTANNASGCLKPVNDTITIEVIPSFSVDAGRDTSVSVNEPVQLFANVTDSAGLSFLWTPFAGLDNPTLKNPTATLNAATDSIVYTVKAFNAIGCFAEDDIKIKIFKTTPEIFIPSAFTPNGDGTNDILKPLIVGITQFNYFRIYNRWGQLVFSTANPNSGWDGTTKGTQQASGTFVYVAEGIDYKGNRIFRKGTVVLIR
jgi:gliding motility-associated-like protein